MTLPVAGLIVSMVSEPFTNSLLMKRPVWTKHEINVKKDQIQNFYVSNVRLSL